MTSPSQISPEDIYSRGLLYMLFPQHRATWKPVTMNPCIYKKFVKFSKTLISIDKLAFTNQHQKRQQKVFGCIITKVHSLQKGWIVKKWQEVDFYDESFNEPHPDSQQGHKIHTENTVWLSKNHAVRMGTSTAEEFGNIYYLLPLISNHERSIFSNMGLLLICQHPN